MSLFHLVHIPLHNLPKSWREFQPLHLHGLLALTLMVSRLYRTDDWNRAFTFVALLAYALLFVMTARPNWRMCVNIGYLSMVVIAIGLTLWPVWTRWSELVGDMSIESRIGAVSGYFIFEISCLFAGIREFFKRTPRRIQPGSSRHDTAHAYIKNPPPHAKTYVNQDGNNCGG